MKRYIQILLTVMCVVAFGTKIKAQEEAHTDYHHLVYYNIMVTHDGLNYLKQSLKDFIDNPPSADKELFIQMAVRFTHIASMSLRPIKAITMAVRDSSIVLIQDDLDAINEYSESIDNSIHVLDDYLKNGRLKKIDYSNITSFKAARAHIRKAKGLLEGILDRGNCSFNEKMRERPDEQD